MSRGNARSTGHTLYELLISLVMIGILAGLCATLAASAREDDRMTSAYVTDLRHVRTASDALATEIRCAREVAVTPDGLVIDGNLWRAQDGVLLCGDAVAVRGVSRLDASRVGEGLFRIAVAPVPRRTGAVVTAPALISTVQQRVEEPR